MGLVIAIDGTAASGKSSAAKRLAKWLGWVYINTGAMYRAVTWLAVSRGVPCDNEQQVLAAMREHKLEFGLCDGESIITVNGEDPTPHLADGSVNSKVSVIASLPEVRKVLVDAQRKLAEGHDVVMEGRDIGSVVFPDTPYKFYIDASPEVREMRRAQQGYTDNPVARDQKDSSRRASPLVLSDDAHRVDSSNLTIEGVVGEILGRLKLKGMKVPF